MLASKLQAGQKRSDPSLSTDGSERVFISLVKEEIEEYIFYWREISSKCLLCVLRCTAVFKAVGGINRSESDDIVELDPVIIEIVEWNL